MKKENINDSLDYDKIQKSITDDNLSEFKKTNYILLKTTIRYYILTFIIFLLFSIITIVTFIKLNNNSILYFLIKILIAVLFFIYFVISSIVTIIKFFFFGDFERLKGYILINSYNFVYAGFFMTQKRFMIKPYPVNNDGKTFSEGKKDYIIDKSCVWGYIKNCPILFYVPNIPNPLDFDFFKYLNNYFSRLEKGENEKNIKENLDIRYSAENLRLLKNDKLMRELHRDKSEDINKMLLYMMIMAGIFLFVIVIIILVLGNKQPQVILQNVTSGSVVK